MPPLDPERLARIRAHLLVVAAATAAVSSANCQRQSSEGPHINRPPESPETVNRPPDPMPENLADAGARHEVNVPPAPTGAASPDAGPGPAPFVHPVNTPMRPTPTVAPDAGAVARHTVNDSPAQTGPTAPRPGTSPPGMRHTVNAPARPTHTINEMAPKPTTAPRAPRREP